MDDRGFRVSKARRHISTDAEVGILIDCARNERWDFARFHRIGPENVRECRCEGRSCLNGHKVGFTHRIAAGSDMFEAPPKEKKKKKYHNINKIILATYLSLKPKTALLAFKVMQRETLTTFS